MRLYERTRKIFETQQAYYSGRITDSQRQTKLAEIFNSPVVFDLEEEDNEQEQQETDEITRLLMKMS